MRHPYSDLPPEAFWASAVAGHDAAGIGPLATARRKITVEDKVVTAGSCFAQHISRRLRLAGLNFVDGEPAPPPLDPRRHGEFGYGLYSARYGNIYTSTQLVQLIERARGGFQPAEDHWMSDGRFYDPFRPTVEPNGFGSLDELRRSRDAHLFAVRILLKRASVFVFTLGLTETWRSKLDGAVYPVAPGVRAGTFDPDRYAFVNLSFQEVLNDMHRAIRLLRKTNPDIRVLLTVSPVPLTATASGEHVLTATTYSKSVLRAVAGELRQTYDFVDYFPSYEMVTAPVFGGAFYEPNQREVRPEGVDFVMARFLKDFCEPPEAPPVIAEERDEDEVFCDEKLLDAFA